MITFLPSRVFTLCAKSLDDKRLVAQVGEAAMILTAILNKAQVGQPAFDMWRPHPGYLAIYGKLMADEHHLRFRAPRSEARLFASHIPDWFWRIPITPDWSTLDFASALNQGERDRPWWLGDGRLHLSHIRALYHKDPEFYAKWRSVVDLRPQYCCVGCQYWWPTHVRNLQ